MPGARFGRGLRQTLRAIAADKAVILLLIIAPLIYGFFYPWPYSTEVVRRVPVAVVDLDHSSLSRQIVRFAQASPRMQVWALESEQAAREALWRGDIAGYALIPRDLKRQVALGRPASVTIVGNGSYLLLNKSVLFGFAEAVGTVSAGIELRQLAARGVPPAAASAMREPLVLQSVALFNSTEGYGSSIVPAVALLILQQTLLMAAGMLTGSWAEMAQHEDPRNRRAPGRSVPAGHAVVLRAAPAEWLGRVVALALPNWGLGFFYFGWIYIWHGYAHGANVPGALLLMSLSSLSVAALGCLLGLWLRDRERIMQVLLFTALPMFFVSGYSWPAQALPWPLQGLRWLVPSTPAIEASVRLNQMGATVADVAGFLLVLATLGLTALALLLWFGRPGPPRAETIHPL